MRAVNLIPVDLRGGASRSPSRSQGGAYVVLGLLAGLALLAFLYGRARHDVSSRQGEVTSLSAQAERAEASAAQLAPYTSFTALREQRVAAITQLVDSRFDWAHAIHEFGRVLPAGVALTSLTGSVGATGAAGSTSSSSSSSSASGSTGASGATGASGSSVTSVTPAGSVPSFTVSGCAVSQQVVANTLQRLRLMDGVAEATLQSSTEGTSSGGGGGCPGSTESFTIQVFFEPLPSESATNASLTKLTSGVGR